MKKFFFTAVLFFSLLSFGQTPISKIIFYDSIRKETFAKEYSFKKIIKEYNLEKKSYEVEYFSKINNVEVLDYRYLVNDKAKLTRHGECTYFYDSGAKKEIENYENGSLLGITKKWYENGNLWFEGEYKILKEKKTLFYYNYWDKNGVQKVKDGNGVFEEFYIDNEEKIFTGIIKNGLKDGIWKSINSNFPKNEVVYKDGVFVKGKIIKSNSLVREYFHEAVNAKPDGGMQEFRNKIGLKIKNSGLTSNYKGKIVYKFTVDENGELVNFSKVEGIHEELYLKLIQIIKDAAKWESGIYNGREVKQYFSLPITLN